MAVTTQVFATDVDSGGTDLRWSKILPDSGGPTWPACIVIHGGQYNSLARGPTTALQDVANAGFAGYAIDYREAPPHAAMTGAGGPGIGDGQQDPPSDGRPPQQTDDVRRAVRAVRADPSCNGKICILGFSCGGAHAAWQGIGGTVGDDKPDAIVTCSGSFDLDNADGLTESIFRSSVQNYVNHVIGEGAPFHAAAQAASPYWLTPVGTPASALLFNSTAETMPQSIMTTMATKLTNAGGLVESHLRTGTEHSVDYWLLGYGGAFPTVKDCAIDFMNRMVVAPPFPTPSGSASIVFTQK